MDLRRFSITFYPVGFPKHSNRWSRPERRANTVFVVILRSSFFTPCSFCSFQAQVIELLEASLAFYRGRLMMSNFIELRSKMIPRRA